MTGGHNEPVFDADEILEGITDWVLTESPTVHVDGVNLMMDKAEAAMARLGAEVSREPGTDGFGDIVIGRVPGKQDGPGTLVLGHLDTVHMVGTLEDRLPLRREGDKVYGPGIYDMKGGMFTAYYALRQLLRAGEAPELPVTFMFIPDEEVGSPSTRARIEEMARAHRHVFVPEPAKGETGRLVTGRYAFLRFTVHVSGKPAHAGSQLTRGRSAIAEMARQIIVIEDFTDRDRGITYSVGTIEGGTFVNVVPIECHAQVLCVAPFAKAMDEIRDNMAGLTPFNPDCTVTVEPGVVRPLFEASDGTMALCEQAEAIAREIGFDPGHGPSGGGSDGNFTGALGIPTLDGLGLMGDGAHTHEEHVLYSSMVPRAKMLAGLFRTAR
ncbi:MAG: carboxypeptidase [Rhodospirillaceae bacterium]|nr:carboxypeptidase [Rhodospirillaceae bacterium]|tara:strand:- start:8637 stop:9782 length:1146 start_codon:yes stop_codon:yes gene_type:complete